jgi:Zn-dependent protease
MDILLFSIIVLIISAVAHEMAHGYAADMLGDPTPRLQGRLTMNPVKHLDPIGSFLLPFLTYNVGGFIFGWAKPVEFNPYNLKHPKRDEIIIALAGPLTNAVIAVAFGLLVRFAGDIGLSVATTTLAAAVVTVNLSLMVFNLIPIPPLDGSKVLLNLISDKYRAFKEKIIESSLIIFFIFVIFGGQFITPVIRYLFTLITGY